MRLRKVHRVLEFRQPDWLKKYIDSNRAKRKKEQELRQFRKWTYKIINHSILWETGEDIRKREPIQLENDPKRVEQLIAKLNFVYRVIITETVCVIQKRN